MYLTNHLSIKSWAEDDRPREKMQIKGKSALSNAELLAILLGSGTRTKTAVELGQEILNYSDNSLYKLGKLSERDFTEFSGIGSAKAITLMAAMELGRRRSEEPSPDTFVIKSSEDAYRLIKPYFIDLEHEEFRIVGLSRANKVIKTELISKGGRSGTVADGKLIFKALLDMKASAGILFHNHPSGNLNPSEADIQLTKKMKEFGRMIDLNVLDHLIITDHGYFSFADRGML
ncbi:MAG: DNA repair protein RadC [Brumimicrobium sp.]|nr:DNA repair protein RadC [Brumimicrobium sp.]